MEFELREEKLMRSMHSTKQVGKMQQKGRSRVCVYGVKNYLEV